MNQGKAEFGIIGLGVMGRNFLLNVAEKGYPVIGLDKDADKANALKREGADFGVEATTEMEDFVQGLALPRKIMLLVPAGKIVDQVIADFLPWLQPGDLILDGGNSHYEDTERRQAELAEKELHFLGVGVSGGAEGARRGPSIMPGGHAEAYEAVGPILEKVAAQVQGDPCVAYLGKGSAGHFVKMVHNGIEYAMMQLIAEAYDLLKQLGGLDNAALHHTFVGWNQSKLASFLIEISAEILDQQDELGEGELIDKILDKAKQKGTGKWTSQSAMDLGIPIPTIDAAVSMRQISAFKPMRQSLSKAFPKESISLQDQTNLVNSMEHALGFAFVLSYAQGLHVLHAVSEEKNYGLELETIARIWRGGCIIRAELLEDIRQAYQASPELPNLLAAPVFQKLLEQGAAQLRAVLPKAIAAGIPTLCFSSALAYFDAFRSARLPLNMVQAQRDYFGSHTYERTDQEGSFHTEWS